MATLAGWRAVGDKARHYITPTGEEVSRRQYLDARAKTTGFGSYDKARAWYQDRQKEPQYQNALRARAHSQGVKPSTLNRIDSPFVQKYKSTFFHPDGSPKTRKQMSMYARGPIAKWLEYIGVRRRGAAYKVGDSPK